MASGGVIGPGIGVGAEDEEADPETGGLAGVRGCPGVRSQSGFSVCGAKEKVAPQKTSRSSRDMPAIPGDAIWIHSGATKEHMHRGQLMCTKKTICVVCGAAILDIR